MPSSSPSERHILRCYHENSSQNFFINNFFVCPMGAIGGCILCFCSLTRRNKHLWSWRRSSIVLSFRATGTVLTENRTQDTFSGILTLFSLSGLKEYTCQVWCKSVYPFSSYKRTYERTYKHRHI
jgi:hypothetical protein